MTILVAGASGLAGSAIVRELTRIGKSVVGISSKDVDLLDRKATFNFIGRVKPKVIIDCAAKVGGISASNNFPVEFLTENIRIQINLMEAAHEVNVKKFVFFPSNLYGPNENFSLESSHVLPALIRKFVEAKKLNNKSVKCWGTGTPRREFLHVDDLARAIVFCIESYDSDQHINIGTGTDLTIKELAGKISKFTGFIGQINWDESMVDGSSRKVLDITKITSLGWKPIVNLDYGIETTVEWYLKNT